MSIRYKDPTFVYLVLSAGWPLFFTVLAVTNLVYQVQVAHLDPLRLLLVGSVLELTCLVFQVPTGLFADAFSRRWAVAAGCGLVGAGFILEGSIPQFTSILLGLAGLWLVWRRPRQPAREPEEPMLGEETPTIKPWQNERWGRLVALSAVLTAAAVLGWWSTEVFYSQQVVYTYAAQSTAATTQK